MEYAFSASNILEIASLNKGYRDFQLRDINLALPKGSIMGLIGENGAGKTTTIKLILNLIRRDSGKITLFGQDNSKDEKLVKEHIGVVLDESCFHDTLNAREISGILNGVYTKRWDAPLFRRYLDQFSLPEKKVVKEYSRGMKMKLSIAAALAHHPRLLILDEATSGLDPVVRAEILDEFFAFIQDEENGILMSSHITSDLEKVADYVTFLHKGRVALAGAKDRILEEHAVVKCGASDYDRMDKSMIVGVRKNSFGCEALTSNKKELARRYPQLALDAATLEDIMLYYAKGEK